MKALIGILISLLVLILGLYGSGMFTSDPLKSKDVVHEGLKKVKESVDLNSEQETLLTVQLAINDYLINNGKPPASLDKLVPKYFEKVPLNPSTKKPFSYRVENSIPILGEDDSDIPIVIAKATDEELSLVDQQLVVASDKEVINDEQYHYDPEGKRDPFEIFDFTPKKQAGLSPLQSYDIGQLRLAAVLTDSRGEPKAIVEDASGKGYTVKVGTKIGNNNGVVTSIEAKKLLVLETVTDFAGRVTENEVEMKIVAKSRPRSSKKRR